MTEVRFALARPEDDGELRALVRQVPMEGWVRLGLEREPRFLEGEGLLGEARVVVAREGDELVGACTCTVMPVFLNGAPATVPYLGGLRLAPRHQGRPTLIRRGFEALDAIAGFGPGTPLAFTSLAAENHRARRLLEAGLRGLPRYSLLGEVETWVLPTGGRPSGRLEPATEADLPALVAFLQATLRRRTLAPCVEKAWLASKPGGLRVQDFLVRRDPAGVVACLALWDQRSFKQIRIHGYRPPLAGLRPLWNAWATLRRGVRLPAPGGRLEGGFLAFAAWRDEDLEAQMQDIGESLAWAARRGLDVAYLGLPSGHALGTRLRRRWNPWTYRTLIEGVRWPGAPALEPDPRPVHPEIALL